jgi:membrane protein EpsK
MSLMTFHLCVNLGILPLFNINVATNNVRTPGTVTCIMGAANLGLAVLLAGPVGWGMYGVAAAGAIMLTAKNLIFTPLYGAYVLEIPYSTFFGKTVPIIVSTLGIAAAGRLADYLGLASGWFGLTLVGGVISLVYAALAFKVLLNENERSAVIGMVASRKVSA